MTMPQELSPLALWGFPLLIVFVWRHLVSTIRKQDDKLDALVIRKQECLRDFASKEDLDILSKEVRVLSADVASVKALAHTPVCRS